LHNGAKEGGGKRDDYSHKLIKGGQRERKKKEEEPKGFRPFFGGGDPCSVTSQTRKRRRKKIGGEKRGGRKEGPHLTKHPGEHYHTAGKKGGRKGKKGGQTRIFFLFLQAEPGRKIFSDFRKEKRFPLHLSAMGEGRKKEWETGGWGRSSIFCDKFGEKKKKKGGKKSAGKWVAFRRGGKRGKEGETNQIFLRGAKKMVLLNYGPDCERGGGGGKLGRKTTFTKMSGNKRKKIGKDPPQHKPS